MIKERYCSSEVCKLLKQKGLKEWCSRCYGISVRHNGEEIGEDEEYELKAEGKGSEIEYADGGCLYNMNSNNTEFENTYACPTQSMACDWLEEQRIIIEVDYNNDEDCEDNERYGFAIYQNNIRILDLATYASRKETVEAALKYVLTHLI